MMDELVVSGYANIGGRGIKKHRKIVFASIKPAIKKILTGKD